MVISSSLHTRAIGLVARSVATKEFSNIADTAKRPWLVYLEGNVKYVATLKV
jgi:hypothetical protein